MDLESWKPVVGYEGAYEVSSHGRVRSLDRTTDRGRKWRGRMMSHSVMKNGYHLVTLWREGAQRTALVHRLVLTAFSGEPPDGTEGLHIDGDKDNNSSGNLRWGTHSENELDKVRHGTHRHSVKEYCPKGHPYSGDNLYIYPGRPHRGCRACRREYSRAYTRKAA